MKARARWKQHKTPEKSCFMAVLSLCLQKEREFWHKIHTELESTLGHAHPFLLAQLPQKAISGMRMNGKSPFLSLRVITITVNKSWRIYFVFQASKFQLLQSMYLSIEPHKQNALWFTNFVWHKCVFLFWFVEYKLSFLWLNKYGSGVFFTKNGFSPLMLSNTVCCGRVYVCAVGDSSICYYTEWHMKYNEWGMTTIC